MTLANPRMVQRAAHRMSLPSRMRRQVVVVQRNRARPIWTNCGVISTASWVAFLEAAASRRAPMVDPVGATNRT